MSVDLLRTKDNLLKTNVRIAKFLFEDKTILWRTQLHTFQEWSVSWNQVNHGWQDGEDSLTMFQDATILTRDKINELIIFHEWVSLFSSFSLTFCSFLNRLNFLCFMTIKQWVFSILILPPTRHLLLQNPILHNPTFHHLQIPLTFGTLLNVCLSIISCVQDDGQVLTFATLQDLGFCTLW